MTRTEVKHVSSTFVAKKYDVDLLLEMTEAKCQQIVRIFIMTSMSSKLLHSVVQIATRLIVILQGVCIRFALLGENLQLVWLIQNQQIIRWHRSGQKPKGAQFLVLRHNNPVVFALEAMLVALYQPTSKPA